MADDDLLTVADVAAQFRVTAQTVRSWIDSGKLRAARVGKSYVILRRVSRPECVARRAEKPASGGAIRCARITSRQRSWIWANSRSSSSSRSVTAPDHTQRHR
jgi:excisionase family DNA binding protein